MTTWKIEAPDGFQVAAAADFYAGFTPMGGAAERVDQTLQLAFLLDGSFAAVSARLTQAGQTLTVEVEGSDDEARVRRQLSRMLGLDVDGRAWAEVGRRCPPVGQLQRRFPGFFTAGFPSPYEAGLGGVLSQRSSIKEAARVRRALSVAHGELVGGLHVVPSPERLLRVKAFAGVAPRKLEVLHGLARAALDGTLDAERLRACPVEVAMVQLEALDGIGPWTAGHMLLRGASLQDALPTTEPRVLRAFAQSHGLPEHAYGQTALQWRPFGMWVAILMVRALRDWTAPTDAVRRGRRALAVG